MANNLFLLVAFLVLGIVLRSVLFLRIKDLRDIATFYSKIIICYRVFIYLFFLYLTNIFGGVRVLYQNYLYYGGFNSQSVINIK